MDEERNSGDLEIDIEYIQVAVWAENTSGCPIIKTNKPIPN